MPYTTFLLGVKWVWSSKVDNMGEINKLIKIGIDGNGRTEFLPLAP
jgi:hypothetical protein